MDEKCYLLFSDGVWSIAPSFEKIDSIIQHHWWPFPLDKKDDPRRNVIIVPVNEIRFSELRKNI